MEVIIWSVCLFLLHSLHMSNTWTCMSKRIFALSRLNSQRISLSLIRWYNRYRLLLIHFLYALFRLLISRSHYILVSWNKPSFVTFFLFISKWLSQYPFKYCTFNPFFWILYIWAILLEYLRIFNKSAAGRLVQCRFLNKIVNSTLRWSNLLILILTRCWSQHILCTISWHIQKPLVKFCSFIEHIPTRHLFIKNFAFTWRVRDSGYSDICVTQI